MAAGMDRGARKLPFRNLADGGIEFQVVASAGSSRSGIRGIYGAALKVAVQASPERGKANDELRQVLAEFLGLSARSVRVASGRTSRRKRIQVSGMSGTHFQAVVARRVGS